MESTGRRTDDLSKLRASVADLRVQVRGLHRRLNESDDRGIVRARGIEIVDHRGTRRLVLGCVDRHETPEEQDEADDRFGIYLHNGRGHLASWWVSDDDVATAAFSKRGNVVLELNSDRGVARWTDNGFDRIRVEDEGE